MALTKVTYGLLSADTSAIDLNIDANTLYVDSSANRVGIGTNSPERKLHVKAGGQLVVAKFESGNSGGALIDIENDATLASNAGAYAGLRFYNDSGFEMALTHITESSGNGYVQIGTSWASGGEKLVVHSNGNVGIGTTSPSSAKLVVSGAKTQSGGAPIGNILIADSTALAANVGGGITFQGVYHTGGNLTGLSSIEAMKENATHNQYGGALVFKTREDQGAMNEVARFTSTKNLKFTGQSSTFESPGFTYHTNNYLYLRGGSSGLILSDDSGINTVQIIDGSSGYINFETADGSSRMRIDSSGNVGIGDTSPEAILHVSAVAPTYTDSSTVFYGGTTNNGTMNGVSLWSSGNALSGGISSNLLFSNSSTPSQTNTSRSSGTIYFGNTTVASKTSDMIFGGYVKGSTSFVERMRIDGSGNVLIGKTTSNTNNTAGIDMISSGAIVATRSGDVSALFNRTTSDGIIILLRKDNTTTGSIGTSGTSMTFGTGTNGAEKMRIDASGNVGIGVTNPAYKLAVSSKLVVGDNPAVGLSGNTIHVREGSNSGIHFPLVIGGGTHTAGAAFGIGLDPEGYGNRNKIAILAEGIGTGYSRGRLHFALDNANDSGQVTLADSKMCITESGNIGIGDQLDSPTFRLDVQSSGSQVRIRETSTSGYATLRVQAAGNTHGLEIDCFGTTSGGAYGVGSGGCAIMNVNNTPLAFGVANSTDMMIDGSGNVVVGNTSQISLGKFSVEFNGTSQNGTVLQTTRSATGSTFIRFNNSSGTAIGSIYQNAASTVLYSTSSDYRLKQNEIAVWDGTTVLKQLKPYKFNWKADPTGEAVHGFFAHELAEVIPDAVAGEKDAVDSEGRPEYQGVDQSRLVPLLVKTIQELEARITELESK